MNFDLPDTNKKINDVISQSRSSTIRCKINSLIEQSKTKTGNSGRCHDGIDKWAPVSDSPPLGSCDSHHSPYTMQ